MLRPKEICVCSRSAERLYIFPEPQLFYVTLNIKLFKLSEFAFQYRYMYFVPLDISVD